MNISKALHTLNSLEISSESSKLLDRIDPRAVLGVTIIYLIVLLSVPLELLDKVIWFAIYPIILSPLAGLSYTFILKKSLYILPFIFLIGIFNPLYNQQTAFSVGEITISYGWLTFFTLIVRGLLCMQALLILIYSEGFIEICNSLKRIGIPNIITTQLFLMYRYLGVLLEECFSVKNSIISRGYGKSSYTIGLWCKILGSIFLRTIDRSQRLHNAMLARGFDGILSINSNYVWNLKSTIFLISWTLVFFLLYLINLTKLFF